MDKYEGDKISECTTEIFNILQEMHEAISNLEYADSGCAHYADKAFMYYADDVCDLFIKYKKRIKKWIRNIDTIAECSTQEDPDGNMG